MFPSFTGKRRCLLWTSIVGGILSVISLILALVAIPLIIDSVLGDYLIIKNGTEAWDRFLELPFPIDFKLNFFNIENPGDVQHKGAAPILKELGPLVYKSYRKKFDVQRVSDEEVSYYTNQIFEYDAETSVLKEDAEISTLNIVVMGLYQIIENAKGVIPLNVEEILPLVIGEASLFTKYKVKELMFTGIPICQPEGRRWDSAIICFVVMLLNLRMINYKDDLTMGYSVFDWKNNTHDGKFVVNTGELDIMKLGNVKLWNDKTSTHLWTEEDNECNKVAGSDIGVFPPYREEGDELHIFSTDVCRVITMSYHESKYFKDIEVYNLRLPDSTLRPKKDETPEESCYCANFTRGLNGEPSCFMDGMLDLYPCYGIPITLSNPHFMGADPKYINSVKNLSPNESHVSYMNLQPLTGVPMEGWIALQINIIGRQIRINDELVEVTKNLPSFSLPIAWFQMGVVITDEYYDIVNEALTLLLAANIAKWVFVGVSCALCIIPASMLVLCKSKFK